MGHEAVKYLPGGKTMKAAIVLIYGTVAAYARVLGKPKHYISRVLTGRCCLTPEETPTWCRLLKVSGPEELYPDGVVPVWNPRRGPITNKKRVRFTKTNFPMPWVRPYILEKYETLDAFGELMYVSGATVSDVLRGRRPLSSMERTLWSTLLGIPQSFLTIEHGWELEAKKTKPVALIDVLAPELTSEDRIAALEASNADLRGYIKELKAGQESLDASVAIVSDSVDQLLRGNVDTNQTLDAIRKAVSRLAVDRAGAPSGFDVYRVDPIPGENMIRSEHDGRFVAESVQGA